MESSTEEKPKHQFDKKYRTIVSVKSSPEYMEMLEWVDANSHGSVDVWFNAPVLSDTIVIDVAFENLDDALIFKIKYSA